MKLITLTGATAAGAVGLLTDLLSQHPEIKLVVPVTTKPQLEGEINGEHYTFITKDEFVNLYNDNKLVEVKTFNTQDGEEVYWGISTESVDVESDTTYITFLSAQGANAFKQHLLSLEMDNTPEVQTILINRSGRDRMLNMLNSKPYMTDNEVSIMCKTYLEDQLALENNTDFDLILKHNNDGDHLRCLTVIAGLL